MDVLLKEKLEELCAKDIMIVNPMTIKPDDKVAFAYLKTLRMGIGGLPVIDENRTIVGMVTQRDILLLGGVQIFYLTVEDVMATPAITVDINASLKEIAELMVEKNIERVPVIEDGKIAGLVTQREIMKVLSRVL